MITRWECKKKILKPNHKYTKVLVDDSFNNRYIKVTKEFTFDKV